MGASLGTDLNFDTPNGTPTSAYLEDPGDGGGAKFVHYHKVADGGNVAQGATDDLAETDPSADASTIALLKGILTVATPPAPSVQRTAALATSLVVKAAAGTLRGFAGYSTAAQFIQVHDAASLPADTAVPELVFPIEADKPFSFSIPSGHICTTGIVICNSSTGPTKTIGAADTWITAYYE